MSLSLLLGLYEFFKEEVILLTLFLSLSLWEKLSKSYAVSFCPSSFH
jgi:hypothetical protein